MNRLCILGLIILLLGCSPKVKTSFTKSSEKSLDSKQEVMVLSLNQIVPKACKYLGKLKIGDNGFTTDCNYATVIVAAKDEARRNGGNIIKLTEIKTPGFSSTCYRIKADIYFAQNITDIEKQIKTDQDANQLSMFGPNPKFAVIYLFRPKNYTGSAVSYDVHIGDTIIQRIKNNSKFAFKVCKEGKTEVWAKTESLELVTIDVKFGEEYYLKCGLKTGLWVGVPEINFLEKSQGRKEYLNVEEKRK